MFVPEYGMYGKIVTVRMQLGWFGSPGLVVVKAGEIDSPHTPRETVPDGLE